MNSGWNDSGTDAIAERGDGQPEVQSITELLTQSVWVNVAITNYSYSFGPMNRRLRRVHIDRYPDGVNPAQHQSVALAFDPTLGGANGLWREKYTLTGDTTRHCSNAGIERYT